MMETLVEALLRHTEAHAGESPFSVMIEGVRVGIMRSDHPKAPSHMVSKPAVCVVIQGAKWAMFGDHRLEYCAGQALIIGIETPSTGRVIAATPGEPCLVLAFELDLDLMRRVAEGLDSPPRPTGDPGRGALVADFQGPLADCALRLVQLLDLPKARSALYPGIMREICYWLLTGPQGGEVARLALRTAPSQRVIDAMHSLRSRFREAVRIEDLAQVAGLSVSTFHRQFKALTSLTPLQYQKQLRLLEARRLMASRAYSAEEAAYDVGYESASQFSREYSRMFGEPPKRDIKKLHHVDHDEAREGAAVTA